MSVAVVSVLAKVSTPPVAEASPTSEPFYAAANLIVHIAVEDVLMDQVALWAGPAAANAMPLSIKIFERLRNECRDISPRFMNLKVYS